MVGGVGGARVTGAVAVGTITKFGKRSSTDSWYPMPLNCTLTNGQERFCVVLFQHRKRQTDRQTDRERQSRLEPGKRFLQSTEE